MNTHVRERESHARRLFIEVTPALRRVLAEVAEAAIDVLDQIDGDPDLEPSFGYLPPSILDEAEPDADAEDDDPPEEDDAPEDGGDLEPDVDDEPFLGWTEDGQTGDNAWSCVEEDFTDPETSAGFPNVPLNNPTFDTDWRARQAAQFDPRLDRRPSSRPSGIHVRQLVTFPHDPPGRPRCDTHAEQRRLLRQAMALKARRRRAPRRRVPASRHLPMGGTL